MSELSRRSLLVGGAATTAAMIAGCTDDGPPDLARGRGDAEPAEVETEPPPAVMTRPLLGSSSLTGDAAGLAAGMSALLFERSLGVIVTADDPEGLRVATSLAATSHWPVLVGSDREPLPEATVTELRRLGAEHVVIVAEGTPGATDTSATGASRTVTAEPTTPSVLDGLQVAVLQPTGTPRLPDDAPLGEAPASQPGFVVVGVEASGGAAVATAAAAGISSAHTGVADPREDATVMSALRGDPEAPVVTLAMDEGSAERLTVMAAMAQRAPELPGGGVTCFPGRRMVALYGHPGAAVLGLLGEQGIEGSVQRVQEYVERYAPLVEESVIPAWEIIASVATGAAGPDGNYSKVWEPATFRPWVDAAKEAGVYVVLDLQPGRSDFLTQAKAYEELLVEPHVGLALDPEWRLGPNERHLVRIGHVEAEEVNAVSDWLAALVREHTLPQKVLTLHQFRLSMIRNRDQVRTDHPELAVVLHADGQGPQGAKQETWRALKADLPEGMWLGWKNFYDEDSPILTPEQTIARVDPTPWFISYQ